MIRLSTALLVRYVKKEWWHRVSLGFHHNPIQVVGHMLDPSLAGTVMEQIDDSVTFDPDHYVDSVTDTPLTAIHDTGTSHLSVLADNGDAVSLTSSVGS